MCLRNCKELEVFKDEAPEKQKFIEDNRTGGDISKQEEIIKML